MQDTGVNQARGKHGSLTNCEPLLLTYQQLAARISVTVNTLYVWVREGRIRPIKIGRMSRFDPEDVVRRLKKGAKDVSRQE